MISSFTMAENPKPRVDIVNDDWVPATIVEVTAENFESVELAYKDPKLQIKDQSRSGDQSAILQRFKQASISSSGCCRWATWLKNILSYCACILNALVKGDQSKSNGACSDLEAGVTRETATTSRGINYSETALSTFVYTLIGLNFSVPFAIMAIRDGRMTKLAEKLILIIALVTLFLETGIIGLISFRGISSYRTAKVIFTIILLLFLGMAVLISLSALCLF